IPRIGLWLPVIDYGRVRVDSRQVAARVVSMTNPEESAGPENEDVRRQVLDLYLTNFASLVRLAALALPEPATAEDLVHEAFVKLYGAWGRVEPGKHLPYLKATVLNLARGRSRRLRVAARHRAPALAVATSAEESALRRETRREVIERLRRLPARQRECLVLRHYEGMSESEIASTLGVSVGS